MFTVTGIARMDRLSLVLGLALLAGPVLRAQESLVLAATNSTWKYFKGTREPSPGNLAAWRARDFAETGWESGPAPFAYGEPGFASGTELTDMQNRYSTLYLRRPFVVEDPGRVEALELAAVCDDGFLAWINGALVAQHNALSGAPSYTALASLNAAEPITYQYFPVAEPGSLLVAGTNLLAVQVFNVTLGSSDLVFDAQLAATLRQPGPPVVTGIEPAPGLVSALTRIAVTFNKAVTGVAAEHFLVNDRPATNVSGGDRVWTFAFPQPGYGPVHVSWSPLHTIRDLGSPPERFDPVAAGSTWAYELLDPEGPSVMMRLPPPGLTVRSLRQIEVLFNKPVRGVEAADLRINGVAASRVTGFAAGPYLFEFPAGAAPARARHRLPGRRSWSGIRATGSPAIRWRCIRSAGRGGNTAWTRLRRRRTCASRSSWPRISRRIATRTPIPRTGSRFTTPIPHR